MKCLLGSNCYSLILAFRSGGKYSAGLQDRLVGVGQDFVADLGVGESTMLLSQVEAELALVAEVKVTFLTLSEEREMASSDVCGLTWRS